jgi:hypothetical protein
MPMQRRTFISGSVASLAVLAFAHAPQPRKLPLIGFLGLASDEFAAVPLAAFRDGLRAQGFIEGKTLPSPIGGPAATRQSCRRSRPSWCGSSRMHRHLGRAAAGASSRGGHSGDFDRRL